MSGGALDASVTLDDVYSVVSTKRVPLAPELAGYLVLEVAEHADPAGGDVDPKSVFVGDEGTVALVKPRREAASGDAEASIRGVLARLLEASGSQTPALAAVGRRKPGAGLPALAEELEAALIPVNRAAGRRALARLAREVKRVTLGVGRNAQPSAMDASPASRRPPPPAAGATSGAASPASVPAPPDFTPQEEPTAARGKIPAELLRKATPSPLDTGELPTIEFEPKGRDPSPSQMDIDRLIAGFGVSGGNEKEQARDLKAMAGLEPTPPPPPEIAKRMETREVPVQQPPRESNRPLPPPNPPPPASNRPPPPSNRPGPGATPRDSGVDQLLAATSEPSIKAYVPPARPPRPRAASVPPDDRQLPTQPSKVMKTRASLSSITVQPKRRSTGLIVLLFLVVIAGGAYAVTQLRPGLLAGPAQPSPSSSAAPAASQGPLPCNQVLVVTDVPLHAEVLLRKGQSPVDVEKMPVGARLEFVATADGFAPKRVVVPQGAQWSNGPDGKPRYEAGVQLDKSRVPRGQNDPWPPAEPGEAVGGQGPPGTVHVVATPSGAEVWMLAGMGPETRIEQQLACDESLDVLVAGPTTYRKRLHVAASDFVPDDTPPPANPPPGLTVPKGPKRIAHVSAK